MKVHNIITQQQYQQQQQPGWPSYQSWSEGEPAQLSQHQTQLQALVRQHMLDYANSDRGQIIADGNRESQGQIFYHKHVQHQPGQHCQIPWTTMGINSYGDVFICLSPAWIPKFVGNVMSAQNIWQILNSTQAQNIRGEILAGSYRYCNFRLCSWKKPQHAAQPEQDQDLVAGSFSGDPALLLDHIPPNLILDFDHTCNYQCPSCRRGLINNNRHSVISAVNDLIRDRVKTLIIDEIRDEPVQIRWAGGEPFISDPYVDLMGSIAALGRANITHVIQTNGSYLKKKAQLVIQLLPTTDEFRISFDAATAGTYARVRVNGVWQNLISNVEWLISRAQIAPKRPRITADFVVQKANYHEISDFLDLCADLGVDHINLQKMWNWDTWPREVFLDQDIWNPAHPQHQELQAQLAAIQETARDPAKPTVRIPC